MKQLTFYDLNKTQVKSIDFSKPCIFFLGGAMGGRRYLQTVASNKFDVMLQNFGIDANFYINEYDFSLFGDRFNNFAKKVDKLLSSKGKNRSIFVFHVFVPLFFTYYVENLFDTVILPRITDSNGNGLPVDEVKNNLRKMVFYEHCYGMRLGCRLDKKLTKKLYELNYSPEQIAEIQKQLVFLSQSPCFVFNKMKSTSLNFLSGADNVLLYKHLYSTKDTITYFEKYNIVSVPQVYKRSATKYGANYEHRLWPLTELKCMTDNGNTMILAIKKAFYNALTLPHIDGTQSLIGDINFDKEINIKPCMHMLEKIPTQKAKDIIFASISISNRMKDRIFLKIKRMR